MRHRDDAQDLSICAVSATKLSEGHCRCEFLLRCGVKLGSHFPILARSRAKTCSEGMVFTAPESISAERRCASSNHAASTSESTGPSSSSHSTRSNISFSAVLSERISSSILASGRGMPITVPAAACRRNASQPLDFASARPAMQRARTRSSLAARRGQSTLPMTTRRERKRRPHGSNIRRSPDLRLRQGIMRAIMELSSRYPGKPQFTPASAALPIVEPVQHARDLDQSIHQRFPSGVPQESTE